ncbi:hypothetical protein LA080_001272 [Diaporthe eres]|nr:hypothetical protein LA080_001272 [Diaporthe eres]
MNFEIEMFVNPHLRGFIDAAGNVLSRQLQERKCSMSLPPTAEILSLDVTACENPEDTMSVEDVSFPCHATDSSMSKGH